MSESVSNNKKAFYDYEILDKYEAGIVLEGSEVKAIRAGKVNLKDSFVRIVHGEAFVFGMHISLLAQANPNFKPDEKRARKLLLHKKEINKIGGKASQGGLTIVPLSLYFNSKNLAKLQIALARGKNVADKRDSIKDKELKKEAAAAMKKSFQ